MSAARLIDVTIDDLRALIREELERARPAGKKEAATGYLSVPAAAEYADCSEETIRAWIHGGKLPRKKAGRHYRVARADLDHVLANPAGERTQLDPKAVAVKILARRR